MRARSARTRVVLASATLTLVAGLASPSPATAPQRSPAPPAHSPAYPIHPYADRSHLLADPSGPNLSAYRQPWRGYLETRSARSLAAGVGLNYNLPADADHDAAVRILASSGVRHLRFEMPFVSMGTDGRLGQRQQRLFDEFLRACKRYGVRPLVLLNANAGAPGPFDSSVRQLMVPAPRGSRVLVLDDVSGLVAGRSGVSGLTEYWMAQVLFTRINPANNTVELSRPLPVELLPGPRQIDTLRYRPLYPVGTREFDESAGGWLRYTRLVLDRVAAHRIADFDVEIWNELSFARWWLEINNYYDPPLYAQEPPDFLRPGGTAWELARRTTALVKARAPRSRVVWGFSNTTFYRTQRDQLPRGTDGQSYHPYGTGLHNYPDGLQPSGEHARWEHDYRPEVRKIMPEGWAHLGVAVEQLPRNLLEPRRRTSSRPPGSRSFTHFMTEHGFQPGGYGVTDVAAAQQLTAQSLLRAFGFWHNKGIDVIDIYCAYDTDPLGMGLLPTDVAPRDYGRLPPDRISTPALRALRSFVAPLRGANVDRPRQLTLRASSYGTQPEVFPAGLLDGRPALPYREMLALLPYQVTADRFLVGAYVMSWDITRPPPTMRFQIGVGNLPFDPARISLLDPQSGQTRPARIYNGEKTGEIVVDVALGDRFTWLVIDRA